MKTIIGVMSISLILLSVLLPSTSATPIPGCKVWLNLHIIPSKHDGLPRNNPDGTFYPGDAFDFSIDVNWNSWCWSIIPKPIQASGLQTSKLQISPIVSYGQSFAYTESGHAEIGMTTSASLSQIVSAYGLICNFNPKTGGTCTRGTTGASISYSPPMIMPKISIDLTKQNLTDSDGFMMRNMDGTYYVWDGINIVFNPDYQWKDQRIGTIEAHTTYSSDLSLQRDFECQKQFCIDTLFYSRALPWTHTYKYAQGQTNWVPQSSDIKKHYFTYKTILYNLGRKIGESQSVQDALVVKYDPIYNASYGYTVLRDNQWWGFGNRPAVALHYLGSKGGGADDVQTIHELRRSKINSFSYHSFAYKILTAIPLNDSMTWSESQSVNFTDENFTYHDVSLQPGKNAAMFVKSGYGSIIFKHPILFTILKTRYDNSTIINTLQSANFAGLEKLDLSTYYFGYPHTRFSTDVIILALHSDGSINNMPLRFQMIPDFSDNATYEQDFIRSKIIHDRDRIFAGIVLHDMYGKNNSAIGNGIINLKAHLTSMVIPSISKLLRQNPLQIPLNLVYEQPSPYNMTITAGTKKISFIEYGFEFDTNWKYVINMDQNNLLNATRYQGIVMIQPTNNFGAYSKILVDGRMQNVSCTHGCTIMLTDENKNSTIEAYNIWGGKASFFSSNYYHHNTWDNTRALEMILLFGLIVVGYVLLRRHLHFFVTIMNHTYH